jgi:hypothetical protein
MRNGKKKQFKSRIVGLDSKPASDFKFNPLNWRRHDESQREALRSMLGDVGWVATVIENVRTGHLIDGHARIEEAQRDNPAQLVPFLKVDLSKAEELAVLATLDPIGAMADQDPEVLDQLLAETVQAMPTLEDLLLVLHGPSDDDDDKEGETKTVEFKQTHKIVIECSSARQQKKIMRQLDEQGVEYTAK